jgi:anti-sigma regulatory factor (Ser/Thr protein kinase)
MTDLVSTEAARFQMNPSAAELVALRRRVAGHQVMRQLPASAREEVLLLVSELVTNAVEAARPGSPITVDVALDHDGVNETVAVTVENFGPPFLLPPHPELPPADEPRGRGLAIAAALADAVHSEHLGGRTRVVAIRNVPR